ncbi:CsgG/HfaB family protein [Maribacter halichondriae]|uniref:CsgG/HfaB family protein n=1 Tax=Maribacter halichondriae TaxID=2980554 RepID=UPI0023583565|nr:CsgG/HfaB family protein [Maribacter sp. Hal144]
MYKRITVKLLLIFSFLLSGCGAYFNQPYEPQDARIGELTSKTQVLRELPAPHEKVVVGVYNFKDQTGQYKNLEAGSSFSTAVSQGATTMLVQALEDSKWFTPIERENLNNLLNERNIIRSTREEYRRNANSNQPTLPPLLYAGILLEGGVVSYDTNIITGGAGARYFGAGASTQYRQDRITIYLRAVSTSNGEILKTVYVSKTILSQSLDASLFRYVAFQRLLEAETGFTKNEPVQLAMKNAIESAVEALIVEGVAKGLWTTADGGLKNKQLMDAYKAQKEYEESQLLYDRDQIETPAQDAITIGATAPLLNGDLPNQDFGFGGYVGYSKWLSPKLSLNFDFDYVYLTGGKSFFEEYLSPELNLELKILPNDKFGPFVYGGAGYIFEIHSPDLGQTKKVTTPKAQLGAGLNIKISDRIDFRVFGESNFTFTDQLDETINGKRDDFYYSFGAGIKYKLGKYKMNQKIND